MNGITEKLLGIVSDWAGSFNGAFNIRENGQCAGRQSTAHIKIESKTDVPGLDIRILPGTKGESVSIPACVTHGDVDDLVYNDFFVGDGADVTEATLAEGAILEMDTSQLGGVDDTTRTTRATLAAGAKLYIRERLLTEGSQQARTDFEVFLDGEDSGVDLISRSVAKGNSHQAYRSRIVGNTRCTGHSECDAIIADNGTVTAAPELTANSGDAALIHEAAIGKIAGEQLLKLRTLGLTEEEAEAKIVAGFLK